MSGSILFLCLITIVSALAVGFVAAYLVMRLEKRPWPYSWPRINRRPRKASQAAEDRPLTLADSETPESEPRAAGIIPPGTGPAKPLILPVSRWPPDLANGELISEIETNLSTARAPRNGHLVAFQTRVLEAQTQRLEALLPDLHKELKSACIDMRLANTLVSLSLSPERGKEGLENSYSGLCRRIAEKLERAMGTAV
jgi:hypothetical protein